MLARNSLLARLAASAASLASRMAASACFSASTSVCTPTHSRIAPPSAQDRHGADEHVPVLAVVPPEPVFHLVERTGPRRPPTRRRAVFCAVVGVDGVEPAPALQLVEGLAGERAPARLLRLELARRRGVPDDRHGRLDQRPEPLLPMAAGPPRPASTEELADLAADGGQHRSRTSSGCWISPLKTSSTPEDLAADRDREPQGAVQPGAVRGRRPREIAGP